MGDDQRLNKPHNLRSAARLLEDSEATWKIGRFQSSSSNCTSRLPRCLPEQSITLRWNRESVWKPCETCNRGVKQQHGGWDQQCLRSRRVRILTNQARNFLQHSGQRLLPVLHTRHKSYKLKERPCYLREESIFDEVFDAVLGTTGGYFRRSDRAWDKHECLNNHAVYYSVQIAVSKWFTASSVLHGAHRRL